MFIDQVFLFRRYRTFIFFYNAMSNSVIQRSEVTPVQHELKNILDVHNLEEVRGLTRQWLLQDENVKDRFDRFLKPGGGTRIVGFAFPSGHLPQRGCRTEKEDQLHQNDPRCVGCRCSRLAIYPAKREFPGQCRRRGSKVQFPYGLTYRLTYSGRAGGQKCRWS